MPTILTKKSDTPGAVPATANLTNAAGGAELAVNTADKRLFTLTSGSAVVELGTNPTTLSTASLTVSTGNLTFSSTGQRITGDMSNATLSNRLAFQTSTTNGNTIVGAFPNGTGLNARLQLFSASDPANASTASMEANAATSLVIINADKTGTGTYLPMTFYTGGSERMRLDTSGNVGIGAATGAARLLVQGAGTSTTAGGNVVGRFQTNGSGYDASIQLSDNVANSAVFSMVGGAINFISNGSNYMNISPSGNVGIGGTAGASNKVQVLGTLPSSGTFSTNFSATGSIPSSTTGRAEGFTSFFTTAAASFTLTDLVHFFATAPTAGAGSTITNQYGFRAESSLTTATNNFGFWSNIASGSNRWNFYAAGTARNYFAGGVEDAAGNLRAIPRTGSAKTSTYTLTVSDVGQFVELGTGGGIDVPNGVFSTGDVVSVFNNTTGNRTISLTITTAYIGGTDADKASVTLATRGVATVLFISNSVCVLSGNVS